jgi:3-keto steroid reductase
MTAPSFKIEATGEKTNDGLGLVWQSNLFGHYAMYRELLPRLRLTPFPSSRVIWMSSLEAANGDVHMDDLQNTQCKLPYEDSKAQLDLVAVTLDRLVIDKKEKPIIRHVVVHPGVANTDILGAAQLGIVVAFLKMCFLYVVCQVFSISLLVLTSSFRLVGWVQRTTPSRWKTRPSPQLMRS